MKRKPSAPRAPRLMNASGPMPEPVIHPDPEPAPLLNARGHRSPAKVGRPDRASLRVRTRPGPAGAVPGAGPEQAPEPR